MIHIKTFYFNPYRECTYVVSKGSSAFLIDPGMYGEKEENRLQTYLDTEGLTLEAILVTHAHPDHVCGLPYLQRRYAGIPIYAQDSHVGTCPLTASLQLLELSISVMFTPGHKEDAVCFYLPSESILFTGDTLFQESIGRTDLPGGDMSVLIRSLHSLAVLPDDTTVYPGHGYTTTLAHEKQYNPYL